MFDGDISLVPLSATLIFVVAVVAGHRYRQVWKTEGPRWQLWVYGVLAAACLCVLAFVPLVP